MSGEENVPVFRQKRVIEFAECDPAGVAHFTTLLKLAEAAEHAWWRKNGLAAEFFDLKTHAWPRVALSSTFRAPARFGEEVETSLFVTSVGQTSISYQATLQVGPKPIATVDWTVVHLDPTTGKPTELPLTVHEKLPQKGPRP